MSLFWWLLPEWKQSICSSCGVNIWNSGGDPDWGLCYNCFTEKNQKEHQKEQEQEGPICDICSNGYTYGVVNKYNVCSEACAIEAGIKEENK